MSNRLPDECWTEAIDHISAEGFEGFGLPVYHCTMTMTSLDLSVHAVSEHFAPWQKQGSERIET